MNQPDSKNKDRHESQFLIFDRTVVKNLTSSCIQVLEAFARAEKKQKPNWREMFTEVYDEMPKDLRYV